MAMKVKKQDVRNFLKVRGISYNSLNGSEQQKIEEIRELTNDGEMFLSAFYTGLETILDDRYGNELRENSLASEVDSVNTRYMKKNTRLQRVFDFLLGNKKSQLEKVIDSENQFYEKTSALGMYAGVQDELTQAHEGVIKLVDTLHNQIDDRKTELATRIVTERKGDIAGAMGEYGRRVENHLKKY
jgi:hypothetical protein